MRAPDLVDVVEAAYVPHAPDAWLEHVTQVLKPLLDRGGGLLGYGFDAANVHGIELGAPLFAGSGREVWNAMQASTEGLEARAVQRTYLGSQPFGTVAQRFTGSTRGIFAELARRNYAPNGFGDLLVLHVVDADRRGCLFAAPLSRSTSATRKEITLWSRIAAHLRAGYRSSLVSGRNIEDAEAILDPGGRLLHARGVAATPLGREALRRAAIAIERARSARTRADALDLWQALVGGRWTLIQRFDADGRRFHLARRNPPAVQGHVRLTAREQEITDRVVRGHANKLIAHELAISEPTVSEHLKHALVKLNVRSIEELREVLGPAR